MEPVKRQTLQSAFTQQQNSDLLMHTSLHCLFKNIAYTTENRSHIDTSTGLVIETKGCGLWLQEQEEQEDDEE
jgi:hypothetical protein